MKYVINLVMVLFFVALASDLMGQIKPFTPPTTEDGWQKLACETELTIVTIPGMGEVKKPMQEVVETQKFILLYAHFSGEFDLAMPMLEWGLDGNHRSRTEASLKKVVAHMGEEKLTTSIANQWLKDHCKTSETKKLPPVILDPTSDQNPRRHVEAKESQDDNDPSFTGTNASDYFGDSPSLTNSDESADSVKLPEEEVQNYSSFGYTILGLLPDGNGVAVSNADGNIINVGVGEETEGLTIWNEDSLWVVYRGDLVVAKRVLTNIQPVAEVNSVDSLDAKIGNVVHENVRRPSILWDSLRGKTILMATGQLDSLDIPFGRYSQREIKKNEGYVLALSRDSSKVPVWNLVNNSDTVMSGNLPNDFYANAARSQEIADSTKHANYAESALSDSLSATLGGSLFGRSDWSYGSELNVMRPLGLGNWDHTLLRSKKSGIVLGISVGGGTANTLLATAIEDGMSSTWGSFGVFLKGPRDTRVSFDGVLGFGKPNPTYTKYYWPLQESLGYGYPKEGEKVPFVGFMFSANQDFGKWESAMLLKYIQPEYQKAMTNLRLSATRPIIVQTLSGGFLVNIHHSGLSVAGSHLGGIAKLNFLNKEAQAFVSGMVDPWMLAHGDLQTIVEFGVNYSLFTKTKGRPAKAPKALAFN